MLCTIEAKPNGDDDQFGQRPRAHLAHYPTAMSLHGNLAYTQGTRRLLVEVPADHKPHHFPLARAERLISVAKCHLAFLLLEEHPAALQRVAHCIAQRLW